MEKGCGSTIWRTYKSEVRGKPERVRRDDPTNPWVELSRRTCSNSPPLEKHAPDISYLESGKTTLSRSRLVGSGRLSTIAGDDKRDSETLRRMGI
jgi:hypothetical protein